MNQATTFDLQARTLEVSRERAVKLEVASTVEAFTDEIYSDSDVEFILNAKYNEVKDYLIETENGFPEKCIVDDIIHDMNPTIDLSLVEPSEFLPPFCGSEEEYYKYQLKDCKAEIITMLSLQHAINEKIKKTTAKMIKLSNYNDF